VAMWLNLESSLRWRLALALCRQTSRTLGQYFTDVHDERRQGRETIIN
jgi:hypothetical protein